MWHSPSVPNACLARARQVPPRLAPCSPASRARARRVRNSRQKWLPSHAASGRRLRRLKCWIATRCASSIGRLMSPWKAGLRAMEASSVRGVASWKREAGLIGRASQSRPDPTWLQNSAPMFRLRLWRMTSIGAGVRRCARSALWKCRKWRPG